MAGGQIVSNDRYLELGKVNMSEVRYIYLTMVLDFPLRTADNRFTLDNFVYARSRLKMIDPSIV